MSDLSKLASEHQQKRIDLSDRTARRVVRLWRQVQSGDLDAGWDAVAPQIGVVVAVGQLQAAKQAQGYVRAAAHLQGVTAPPTAIVPQAFTGVTLEGREVIPELYTGVTTTKRMIGRGIGVGAAFSAGTAMMTMLAAQMVRDAGNMADKAAGLRRTVKYARMLSPGACSRCAILAGVGNFTKHFERHPQCKCTTVPIYSDEDEPLPEGLFGSAGEYFESLSKAEQDRVFTKSGAEAIRLGANENAVVNARRGMYATRQPGSLVSRATPRTIIGPDGVPFQAYTTTEGTSVRGWFGGGHGGAVTSNQFYRSNADRYRRTTTVRLMPETILARASSAEDAVRLLREFGYFY